MTAHQLSFGGGAKGRRCMDIVTANVRIAAKNDILVLVELMREFYAESKLSSTAIGRSAVSTSSFNPQNGRSLDQLSWS